MELDLYSESALCVLCRQQKRGFGVGITVSGLPRLIKPRRRGIFAGKNDFQPVDDGQLTGCKTVGGRYTHG